MTTTLTEDPPRLADILGESLGLSPRMLFSMLLLTVIVGGMRTTRRATLTVLASVTSAAGLCGKLWAWSPHRAAWPLVKKLLPQPARRVLKGALRGVGRLIFGKDAFRKAQARHRHSLKKGQHAGHHHGHGGARRRHLNTTITLYRRMPLKAVSRLWGSLNDLEIPVFLRRSILGLYVWLFSCKLDEAKDPELTNYRNLQEFFRRELKDDVRPIDDSHVLTSPADGRVLYYGEVKHGILEQVKGVTYSLRGFLGPQTWESAMHGQDINHQSDQAYQQDLSLKPGNELHHCIIYLAPGDYHRFHSPVAWTIEHRRHFPGELLSVSPGIARWVQGLFNFNERVVYTGAWEHGFFSMTPVGATNVGSIRIYCDQDLETNQHERHPEHTYFDRKMPSVAIQKGDMVGEFNLGSTIVLIFEAPRGFNFKIKEGQKIKFGEPIGTTP